MSNRFTIKRISISPAIKTVTCIMALLFSGLVYSGAWTGPKGTSYNKIGLNFFSSDKAYDGNNNSITSGSTFTDVNLTYYGEYGVADNLSIFGSIPFKSLKSDPDTAAATDNSGIGDIDIGARYNLYNEDWGILSIQGLLKIPEAYDKNDAVPLGSGQYDIEVRLLYGKSLYPKPMYYGLEVGYRLRAQSPSDEIRYLGEFGYTVSDKISLRAKLDGTASVKNGDTVLTAAGNPTLAPDFDLGKLDLTVSYTLKKGRYVELSFTPTLYGRNTADGASLSLAFIVVLNP